MKGPGMGDEAVPPAVIDSGGLLVVGGPVRGAGVTEYAVAATDGGGVALLLLLLDIGQAGDIAVDIIVVDAARIRIRFPLLDGNNDGAVEVAPIGKERVLPRGGVGAGGAGEDENVSLMDGAVAVVVVVVMVVVTSAVRMLLKRIMIMIVPVEMILVVAVKRGGGEMVEKAVKELDGEDAEEEEGIGMDLGGAKDLLEVAFRGREEEVEGGEEHGARGDAQGTGEEALGVSYPAPRGNPPEEHVNVED
jgi:hypothetical protein